jgi:hypothetical protein
MAQSASHPAGNTTWQRPLIPFTPPQPRPCLHSRPAQEEKASAAGGLTPQDISDIYSEAGMEKIHLKQFGLRDVGPIESAELDLKDLTVLVGKQATGKTLFLELLKLVLDKAHIHSQLRKHGFTWENKNVSTFLDLYLGEGMHTVWTAQSQMIINGKEAPIEKYISRRKASAPNYAFYIPAQRVITMENGWPRPFQSYRPQDPYVVREFSEQFRMMMEKEFSPGGSLFPQTKRLKKEYRDRLQEQIFGNYELKIDTHGAQKRLMLSPESQKAGIPYMAWSSGQREFTPLLLGLYWLLPPARISKRDSLEWVIIEEIEMGLHPSAISAVMLIVMELLSRGYKVCLSTHSPHVLDIIWALGIMRRKETNADKLLDLFGCGKKSQTRQMAENALKKEVRVYFFDGAKVKVRDISTLDPASQEKAEAGWGGLTEFSGHVSDIVASIMAAD